MNDKATDKKSLRPELRRRAAAIPRDEKLLRSERIASMIENDPLFAAAKVIMAFWPLSDEPQLGGSIRRWAQEKTICLPAMEGGVIVPRLYDGGELKGGAFGTKEPGGEAVPIEDIGLALVPGLGFDLGGGRIGRGKGCYDGFLARYRGESLGICFREQLVEDIPLEAHDRRVGRVICG